MRFLIPPGRGGAATSARAELVGEWLSVWLKTHVEVAASGSYAELADALRNATVDIAWAPPLVCAQVQADARQILTAVRSGSTHSVAGLVVRAEDPLLGVRDLHGARAAWVDPMSMSGYISAIAFLRARGIATKTWLGAQSFAGNYRDALLAVLEKRADVTSIYGTADPTDTSCEDAVREMIGPAGRRLRILSRTDPAPFDGIVFTRRLSVHAAEDLADRFLTLRRDGGTPAILLEVMTCDALSPALGTQYAGIASFLNEDARR